MKKDGIGPFDQDVTLNGGYLYTTNAKLSSKFANDRLTRATRQMISLKNKSVIDVGCGDGVYTHELFQSEKPKRILGIDASKKAIRIAQKLYQKRNLTFQYVNIYHLERLKTKFDIAIVRGVLHHVDDPRNAIVSIAKIASTVLILEPNGYNPLLKIIEKISPYHRQHEEKSYPPHHLRRWLELAGLRIVSDSFVGLVPFFSPDPLARILKKTERIVEKIPILPIFTCGVYVVLAKR